MSEVEDLYTVVCIDSQIGVWVPTWVLGPNITPQVSDDSWVFPTEPDLASWRSWLEERALGLEGGDLWYVKQAVTVIDQMDFPNGVGIGVQRSAPRDTDREGVARAVPISDLYHYLHPSLFDPTSFVTREGTLTGTGLLQRGGYRFPWEIEAVNCGEARVTVGGGDPYLLDVNELPTGFEILSCDAVVEVQSPTKVAEVRIDAAPSMRRAFWSRKWKQV